MATFIMETGLYIIVALVGIIIGILIGVSISTSQFHDEAVAHNAATFVQSANAIVFKWKD